METEQKTTAYLLRPCGVRAGSGRRASQRPCGVRAGSGRGSCGVRAAAGVLGFTGVLGCCGRRRLRRRDVLRPAASCVRAGCSEPGKGGLGAGAGAVWAGGARARGGGGGGGLGARGAAALGIGRVCLGLGGRDFASGGDKDIFFFFKKKILFAESHRYRLSAKKQVFFLKKPLPRARCGWFSAKRLCREQKGRLSAKTLCREPDVQALGKEVFDFFILFLF